MISFIVGRTVVARVVVGVVVARVVVVVVARVVVVVIARVVVGTVGAFDVVLCDVCLYNVV